MAEIAPPGGGGVNRRFLYIVGGLGALLALGLLGLGVVLFLGPAIQNIARGPTAAPTRLPATPTTAPTLTRVPPTTTPTVQVAVAASPTAALPTATATVLGGNTPVAPQAQVTPAEATGTQLPSAGLGDNLLLLAGGVILVLVVFAVRRVRLSS